MRMLKPSLTSGSSSFQIIKRCLSASTAGALTGSTVILLYNNIKKYVPRSDKRATKSLGRSRDNWRKHHLGVILSIYCLWYFHIVWRLFYHTRTTHSSCRPKSDFKKPFQMKKAYIDYSSVNPFRSIFCKCPLYYHRTSRGHKFTLA